MTNCTSSILKRLADKKVIVQYKYEVMRDAIGELGERQDPDDIILNDEQSILTVSTYLSGEYGHKDIYVGVPAIITSKGVREILELPLNEEDQAKFDNSCKIIKETIDGLNI